MVTASLSPALEWLEILRRFRAATERFGGPNGLLTPRQTQLLLILADAHQTCRVCTVKSLAQELGVSKSIVTRMLNTFEKRKIALRSPHPLNKRIKHVFLAPRGKEIVRALETIGP